MLSRLQSTLSAARSEVYGTSGGEARGRAGRNRARDRERFSLPFRAMSAHRIAERGESVRRLERESFDALVVGGGITGAALAFDLSLRGLSVALIERDDFACATSSASSRL